jgi:hypothetical protein
MVINYISFYYSKLDRVDVVILNTRVLGLAVMNEFTKTKRKQSRQLGGGVIASLFSKFLRKEQVACVHSEYGLVLCQPPLRNKATLDKALSGT